MAGEIYINSDLFIDGVIKMPTVPNNSGTVLTYNPTTQTISTRLNSEFIDDLDLVTVDNAFNTVPFNFFGVGSDANTITHSGFYKTGQGSVNTGAYTGSVDGARMLLHFQTEDVYSASQIQTERYSGNIVSRTKNDGGWTGWIRHWGENDFTLTDVNNWKNLVNASGNFVTTNTDQNITGTKSFKSSGTDEYAHKLWVRSDDGSNPGMTFWNNGVISGILNLSVAGFNFVSGNTTTFIPIKTGGFKKDGSDDNYLLLGGGGHKQITDFALANSLNNYWKKWSQGGIEGFQSDNTFYFLDNGVQAQRIATGGILASNGYADLNLVPNLGIYSKGNIRTGGLVSSYQGFQNTEYFAGRNRIWSFGNSDGYGLSYQQGGFNIGGVDYGEGINFHFGNPDDFQVHIQNNGLIHTKYFGNSEQWIAGYNKSIVSFDNVPGNNGDVFRINMQNGLQHYTESNGHKVLDTRNATVIGTDGNADYFPNGQHVGLNNRTTSIFHTLPVYSGEWASSIVTKGWSDNYRAWRISGTATTGDVEQEFYLNQTKSSDGTWMTDRKIWTEKHFTQTNVTNWNNLVTASGNYVTIDTPQGITGKKEFTSNGGYGINNNSLWISTNNTSYDPSITFNHGNNVKGQIKYAGLAGFRFTGEDGLSGMATLQAGGYHKAGRTDDYVLLAGGGDKPLTDFLNPSAIVGFATESWVNTYFIPKTHPVYNVTLAQINSWNDIVTNGATQTWVNTQLNGKVSQGGANYYIGWDGFENYFFRDNILQGYLWHTGNLNPNNFIPTTHPSYGINQNDINQFRKYVGYWDNRNLKPNDVVPTNLQFGFGNWYNNNNQNSHYSDYLHFGGYIDGSGGSQNLIMFSKSGFGIRQFQKTSQDTNPYTDYVDFWNTSHFTQTNINNWNNIVQNQGNFVPYTGATQNVDLNGKNLSNINTLSAGTFLGNGFYSNNLTGGQVFNSSVDTLYVGNSGLPTLYFESSGNIIFSRSINILGDNEGVKFYEGGKIYKKGGYGVVINRGTNELNPKIESSDGSQMWDIIHSGNGNLITSGHVPYTGANQMVNLNDQNLTNVNGLWINKQIIHNTYSPSTINIAGSGYQANLLIKTGAVPGNMVTFTVKLYSYPERFYEFQVNLYHYADSHYLPTITWKSGLSNDITRIDFLKDSNNVLYVHVVVPINYGRAAITDIQGYPDSATFLQSNWNLQFNPDVTGLTLTHVKYPYVDGDFIKDYALKNHTHPISDITNLQNIIDSTTSDINNRVKKGDSTIDAIGFSGGNIDEAPYIYTSGGLFRFLATQTWVNQQGYLTNASINYVHKINPGSGITNDSNSNTNKTWFDYSWGGTGALGSVINFSGFGGADQRYSTELFGEYNSGGNRFGLRTKNGDNGGTWNPIRWIWTDGNFNPNNYVLNSGLNGILSNYVDKTSDQTINGVKKFTGYHNEWTYLDDATTYARGFVQSVGAAFYVGTLNAKPLELFVNANAKVTVDQSLTTFHTFVSVPNGSDNSHAINLGQLNTYNPKKLHSDAQGTTDLNNLMEDYKMRYDTAVYSNSSNIFPNSLDNANGVLSISTHPNYGTQLGFNTYGQITYRGKSNGAWGQWDIIANQKWVNDNYATQAWVNSQITTASGNFLDTIYLMNKTSNSNDATGKGIMTNYMPSTDPNKPTGMNDGSLLTLNYSSGWSTQLLGDWRTKELYFRTQENGTWKTFAKIWHSDNIKPVPFANKKRSYFRNTPAYGQEFIERIYLPKDTVGEVTIRANSSYHTGNAIGLIELQIVYGANSGGAWGAFAKCTQAFGYVLDWIYIEPILYVDTVSDQNYVRAHKKIASGNPIYLDVEIHSNSDNLNDTSVFFETDLTTPVLHLTNVVDIYDNKYLPKTGGDMTGMINFADDVGGIMGTNGVNDTWRVIGRSTGNNGGYLELGTGDDGNEPIYARQWGGPFSNLVREAILLGSDGNTFFPGTVSTSTHGNSGQWNTAYDFVLNGSFKKLRSVPNLNDVSESGIYRQEQPSSGFAYTTTLNLNSNDGRQQLTIERQGGGIKFRGTPYGSGDQGWTSWKTVWDDNNLQNPATQTWVNSNTASINHTHNNLVSPVNGVVDPNSLFVGNELNLKFLSAVYENGSNMFPAQNSANSILHVSTWSDSNYGHQLGFSSNGFIYQRYKDTTGFTGWGKMLTDRDPGVMINDYSPNDLFTKQRNFTWMNGAISGGGQFTTWTGSFIAFGHGDHKSQFLVNKTDVWFRTEYGNENSNFVQLANKTYVDQNFLSLSGGVVNGPVDITQQLRLISPANVAVLRGTASSGNYLTWKKYDGSADIAYIGSDMGSAIGGGVGNDFVITNPTANIQLNSANGLLLYNGLEVATKNWVTNNTATQSWVNQNFVTLNTEQKIITNKTIGENFTQYSGWSREDIGNTQVGPFSLLNLAINSGYPIYEDDEFRYGTNGIVAYNNAGTSAINITLEADSTAPNRSGYVLKVKRNSANGATTPGLGGWIHGIPQRANAVFLQKFVAKVPVGFYLVNAENYVGDGGSVKWLTPRAGTGKYETYVRSVICGTGGGFGGGGHIYLDGPGDYEILIASSNVFELNSSIQHKFQDTISGMVPYTGANQNLNLGQYGLSTIVLNSPNLSGTQVFNASNASNLYIGNGAVPNVRFEASSQYTFHVGSGIKYWFNNSSFNSRGDIILEGASNGDLPDLIWADSTGAEKHRLWDGANTLSYRYNNGTTYGLVHTGNLDASDVVTKSTQQGVTGLKVIDRVQSVGAYYGVTTDLNLYSMIYKVGQGPNTTDNRGASIGFYDAPSGGVMAGIYVKNNGQDGTHMAFATTHSYSSGPQIGMTMNNYGKVNFERTIPSFQGLDLVTQNYVDNNFISTSYTAQTKFGQLTLNSGLGLPTGQRIALKGLSDGSYYIKHFTGDDSVGFGINTKFTVKPYNDEGTNLFSVDANGTTVMTRAFINGALKFKVTVIDLTAYDPNTYYPVTLALSTSRYTKIKVYRTLDGSYGVPPYSTHGVGFMTMFEIDVLGHGWGTTDGKAYLREYKNFWVTGGTETIGYKQMINSTQAVVYLRGGSKYDFEADIESTPVLRTSYYEIYGEVAEPTTTRIWQQFVDSRTDTLLNNFLTTDTTQYVTGQKRFRTDGIAYHQFKLEVNTNNGSYFPGISFHKEGYYGGSIQMIDPNTFAFRNNPGTDNVDFVANTGNMVNLNTDIAYVSNHIEFADQIGQGYTIGLGVGQFNNEYGLVDRNNGYSLATIENGYIKFGGKYDNFEGISFNVNNTYVGVRKENQGNHEVEVSGKVSSNGFVHDNYNDPNYLLTSDGDAKHINEFAGTTIKYASVSSGNSFTANDDRDHFNILVHDNMKLFLNNNLSSIAIGKVITIMHRNSGCVTQIWFNGNLYTSFSNNKSHKFIYTDIGWMWVDDVNNTTLL